MNKPIDTERRLVAIFAADVEGYSRLMGADEVGTLRGLTERRAILDGLIAAHRGRIANTAGDSVLAEFGSAVDAVQCAVAAQEALTGANEGISANHHINFRIGVHVGDVMVKGGDLFGDGVNVAARLQTLATPGGVCLSGVAHDQVRKILPFSFTDLGIQQVKNIEEPVRAFAVSAAKAPATSDTAKGTTDKQPLPLPDKPSIAVLPFQNMSGDPEQEYFADGIVEDIITALSRFKSLFVIARNSSFTYKGRAVDVKQVGHELGVRYVLEGSVRKAANRVRITGQLIDAGTGNHLWADRFDASLDDIFDLQDRVTASVVGAIAPTLELAEMERAHRKPTESLVAYDFFLRGLAYLNNLTKDANNEALEQFYRAIELDPAFASPYSMAARCYTLRVANNWINDFRQEAEETKRLAQRGADLGQNDAVALCFGGFALARVCGDLDGGAAHIERAIALNPNLASAWNFSGFVKALLGQHEVAIEHIAKAIRFNPLDPSLYSMQGATALAHFFAGRYDDALKWSEKTLREKPSFLPSLRMVAMSHALAGRLVLAKDAMAQAREIDPTLRISTLTAQLPLNRPEDRAKYEEGLRRAGLPE